MNWKKALKYWIIWEMFKPNNENDIFDIWEEQNNDLWKQDNED